MNKIMTRRASALLLVFALTLGLNAQPGAIDLGISFGDGANNTVQAIALQPDGKILIAGDFTSYNGTDRNGIARLNADGSLDTDFNPGTGTNDNVWAIALQPDGKILIGGYFTSYNGTSRSRIARLNADGSLDTGFNPGTGANGTVFSIALQPDGKILIGGQFLTYNGTGRRRIARLNADGSLDTSFNPGVGASNSVNSIALQPDGKILIGGSFTFYNGTSRSTIARLNTDGSLDASFDPGTGAFGSVWAVALQPDGKILIGGDFSNFNGTARKFIARLNVDGSLDLGFDPGTGANHLVLSIAVQLDGKVLIGGIYTNYNGTGRRRIARLNANGSLDTGFDPGTGSNNIVYSIALQPDGNILIGGDFTNYNGTSRKRVALVMGGEPTCLDADNDGYEDAACGGEDCDDTNNALNPNTVWYLDADSDGYYIGTGVTQCASPGTDYRYTGILGDGDCNDGNAAINPNAVEVCDNIDNDCDNLFDANDPNYVDNTPPEPVCLTTTVYLQAYGIYALQPEDVVDFNASFDNCGSVSVTTITPSTVDCSQLGQTLDVTVTTSDARDNYADCTAHIVVQEGADIPDPWAATDVGTNANGLSSFSPCTNGGTFILSAQGYTTNTTDVQHTVYQEICDNEEIVAHVAGIVPNGGWAGIEMRESDSQGAKKFTLKTQMSTLLRREIRNADFGPTNTQQIGVTPTHTWLRLVRAGNTFTAFSSADGATWVFRSAASITMNSCVMVGLFVESINNTTTTMATFDHVSINGSTPSTLAANPTGASSTHAFIGMPQIRVYPNPSNGAFTLDIDALPTTENGATLAVFDTQGNIVLQKHLSLLDKKETVDISSLPDGMYWMRLQGQNLTPWVYKLVKSAVIRP